MTRPREHLYLYLQKKKENEGILKFIDNKMNGLPDENEFDLYPNTEENWRKIAEEHSEKNSESISIELNILQKNGKIFVSQRRLKVIRTNLIKLERGFSSTK